MYIHVPRSQALGDRSGKFVKTRLMQTVKGDDVRCRLVAQEFARGDPREDLFAGTPPLFAARLLVSRTATRRSRQHTLMVLDVSCAFLYAPIKRTVYIELPEEDEMYCKKDLVGKLNLCLYGTRDAASNWQETLSSHLVDNGFSRGIGFHAYSDMMRRTLGR